jgi:hypothetical protein
MSVFLVAALVKTVFAVLRCQRNSMLSYMHEKAVLR